MVAEIDNLQSKKILTSEFLSQKADSKPLPKEILEDIVNQNVEKIDIQKIQDELNKIIANTVQKVSFKEIFTDRNTNIKYVIILLIVTIYIMGETVFGNWTPVYLRLAKGLDIQSAALSVTLFNIFIVVGRFIASSLAGKIKANTILLSISVLAIVSSVFFVFSDTKLFIYLAISLVGLGYSAMYPLLVSSGSTLYKKGQGTLSAIIFAAGYGGKTITPFITKATADKNLTISILVAMIFSGIAA